VEVEVVDVLGIKEEMRRVDPSDTSELNVLTIVHVNKVWTTTRIVVDELSVPPHESSSIYLTFSIKLDIGCIVECEYLGNIIVPV